MPGSTISIIIGTLVTICIILCAHYLSQIRDLLKEIRDAQAKPERRGSGYTNR